MSSENEVVEEKTRSWTRGDTWTGGPQFTKDFLTAIITSDKAIEKLLPTRLEIFSLTIVKTIIGWVTDYKDKYKKAPKTDFNLLWQNIKHGIEKDAFFDWMEEILRQCNKEYEEDESGNEEEDVWDSDLKIDMLLDEVTLRYYRIRKHEIERALEKKDTKALQTIFKKAASNATPDNQKLALLERTMKTRTEFLEMVLPPRNPIIDPWLFEDSMVMIYGDVGSGKSMLCSIICSGITSYGCEGFAIGPWTIRRPYGVLYFDAEMTDRGLQDRIRRMCRGLGREYLHQFSKKTLEKFKKMGANVDPENKMKMVAENIDYPLRIITSNQLLQDKDMYDIETGDDNKTINMDDKGWRDTIYSLIKRNGNNLSVFDNFRSMTEKTNENQADEIKSFNKLLQKIRWLHNPSFLVHHANKLGGPSGSTELTRPHDVIIKMTKLDTEDGTFKTRIKLFKTRDLPPQKSFILRIEEDKDEDIITWKTESDSVQLNFKEVITGLYLTTRLEPAKVHEKIQAWAIANERGKCTLQHVSNTIMNLNGSNFKTVDHQLTGKGKRALKELENKGFDLEEFNVPDEMETNSN